MSTRQHLGARVRGVGQCSAPPLAVGCSLVRVERGSVTHHLTDDWVASALGSCEQFRSESSCTDFGDNPASHLEELLFAALFFFKYEFLILIKSCLVF